jgi:MFS family permease
VQLYLLQLDGVHQGTIYVAAALTAFNAVSIPAAIVWGFVTDRLRIRKNLIVVSYLATTVVLLSFLLTLSNSGVVLLFSLVSFISAASATPLNLLIMETEPKNHWATGFARLSLVSSIGATVGYAMSSVWVQFLPVAWLVVPFAAFSSVSVAMSVLLIQEPKFVFEGEVGVLQRPGFLQRLLAFPLIFLNIPRLSDFRRVFQGLRSELTSYQPLLYLSIICFYFAGGIFNTSIVPALTAGSLSGSQIYLVSVAVLVTQIFSFRYAGRYVVSRSLTAVAVQSLILRGAAYALQGAAALLLSGTAFLLLSSTLYALSSGVAYGIYYTASNTMIFNSLKGRNHGSSLGVYSALVGVSTTLGSIVSGVASLYLGFHVTFILAGAILGLTAWITSRLPRGNPEQGTNS